MHSQAILGERCTLYHGVTLGDLGGWGGAPRVGHDVLIGAGAKLLGQIDIGDHCRIGANAVVLTSVPPGCVAVGIPAVIKARTVQGRGLALEELVGAVPDERGEERREHRHEDQENDQAEPGERESVLPPGG